MPPQRALEVCAALPLSKSFSGDKDSIALREAVAHLYNTTYRQGRTSQYTYENVCIVPGGRAGLSRIAAVIGDVYCVRYLSYIFMHTTCPHGLSRSPTKFPTIRHTIKCYPLSGVSFQSLLRTPRCNV